VEWELLNQNPAQGAKLPKVPEGRTRYLSPTELKASLEAAPEWMRAPIALAAFTGMRRGELLGLRWEHVHLAKRIVHLPLTKNGESRDVPLSHRATATLTALSTYKQPDVNRRSNLTPDRRPILTPLIDVFGR